MRGLPTLVAYRRAHAQSASIRTITDRYRRATNETLKLAFASSAVLELVATLSVALVAVTVGLRLAAGSLDLGTALVVLLLAPEAYWPIRKVGAEFHSAAEGVATFEAADALIAEGGSVRSSTAGAGTPLPGGIVVDGLTVGYADRDVPALDGFSCLIGQRGLTAVVGPSGAGKSTLLAVLLGELEPSTGTVTVAGHALGDLDPTSWQSRIAWIPQRPWILPGTVRDNVLLGRPAATDVEVWAALERVALADLVATLPGGLDEPVGEDGAYLSAGERARLALSRAVLAGRPLVLLDEPTAHLDPVTEEVITDTLVWLAARSAVVVVAHKPTLVALADHVVTVPVPPAPVEPVESRGVVSTGSSRGRDTTTTERGSTTAGRPKVATDPIGRRLPSRPPRTALRLWGGAALGALAAASGVALTATAGWLIARAAEHPPVLVLTVAIVGVRAFGLARPALRYAERLVSHDAALRLLADRRAAVYDALVPLVPGRLGKQRGDVLTSVVDDVDALVDKHLRVRAPLVTFGLVGLMAVTVATLVLPSAGLVTLGVLLVGGGSAYLAGRAGVAGAEPRLASARGRLGALVVQTLQGAPDLLAWQAAGRALDDIDAASRDIGAAASRSARAPATGRALAVLAAGVGVAATAWAAAAGLDAGALTGPMAALLVLLPLALLDVTSPLADAGALQVRTRAADRRLAELTAADPLVTDPVTPVDLAPDAPHVVLEGVGASWSGRPVLRDLDLDLRPGTRLGVVGPSGCGKSTLAALLLRFLDPHTGAVRLSGRDLRELTLDDVRRSVGVVDDDPHVFASSLRENLRLARPEATADEIVAALRGVQLGPWLDGLPAGLDTMVGDGHAQVSGGERARIGLARAVLADLPVLVLDEPTAHLDTGTAQAVTDDLLAAGRGRTVVWITHGSIGLDRMEHVLDLGRDSDPPESSNTAALAAAG